MFKKGMSRLAPSTRSLCIVASEDGAGAPAGDQTQKNHEHGTTVSPIVEPRHGHDHTFGYALTKVSFDELAKGPLGCEQTRVCVYMFTS